VEALHRSRVGGLELGDLPLGQWRALAAEDIGKLWSKAAK
jgi:16S rRNA pseudouridine516 synthase